MIELFSAPSVHSRKVHIVLEELELPYRVRPVDLAAGDQRGDAFTRHNPFGQAPALHDPDGPAGAPISLGESAAIALYLARKAGRLGPETPREEAEFDYWAHAISSSLAAPLAAHLFFATRAPQESAWALQVFADTAQRMLDVFDARLATRHFMIGERFTVIDALLFPHLAAPDLPRGLDEHANLMRYVERIGRRDGVRRGMAVLAA